jgi:hypothetical protein
MTRHPLGVSWAGAMPKWASASRKKPCGGTGIPASSALAYTQMAPGGGVEFARRSPAGRAVNSLGTPYFSQIASTCSCVRRNEAKSSGRPRPAVRRVDGTTAAVAAASRSMALATPWVGAMEGEENIARLLPDGVPGRRRVCS